MVSNEGLICGIIERIFSDSLEDDPIMNKNHYDLSEKSKAAVRFLDKRLREDSLFIKFGVDYKFINENFYRISNYNNFLLLELLLEDPQVGEDGKIRRNYRFTSLVERRINKILEKRNSGIRVFLTSVFS